MSDVLASRKFGSQQNFLKGLLQKYFDGKVGDKNNYLVSKTVDWELKALLKSETFVSLEELRKRSEKSGGYAGL